MSDVVFMRGSGGAVWEMTLPLSEHARKQFDAGDLVQVNADGSPYEEPRPRRRRAAGEASAGD